VFSQPATLTGKALFCYWELTVFSKNSLQIDLAFLYSSEGRERANYIMDALIRTMDAGVWNV